MSSFLRSLRVGALLSCTSLIRDVSSLEVLVDPAKEGTIGDETAFLQKNLSIAQRSRGGVPSTGSNVEKPYPLQKVQLRKQYVPISRNGTVVAYKTAYFGEIQVGAPAAQTFTVVFDTGSGHLILPSSGCESETCTKHRRYSRDESGTSVDIDHKGQLIQESAARDQVAITFGTGKVTGDFAQDGVCLGGATEPCTNLRMVLANDMSPEPFGLFKFDGVLGLGFGGLLLAPEFSFFGQMIAQNPAMPGRFAVFLARNEEGESSISFGGHEEEKAASDIRWAPVAMPELGYWQVGIKRMLIGDSVVEECEDGSCRAILDTGTSLLGVPRGIIRNLQRSLARPPVVGDEDNSDVDCRNVPGQLVTFELAGPDGPIVTIGHEDYSRPKPYNVSSANSTKGWELTCRSLLLPIDMKAPIGPMVFIWGEPMLRRYYTIYDWVNKQVGFSTAGESSAAGEGAVDAPDANSLAAGVPLRTVATTTNGAQTKTNTGPTDRGNREWQSSE